MNRGKDVFAQVLSLVNRYEFQECVHRYKGDYGTSSKSDLFISGLSMGGFGALRLGAKFQKMHKVISGHSSITNTNQIHLFVEEAESNNS